MGSPGNLPLSGIHFTNGTNFLTSHKSHVTYDHINVFSEPPAELMTIWTEIQENGELLVFFRNSDWFIRYPCVLAGPGMAVPSELRPCADKMRTQN